MRTTWIVGLLLCGAVSSEAQINWQRLTSVDAVTNAALGERVALHGDYLLAGAPAPDGGGVGPGQAFVFVRGTNGWSQQAMLTPQGGMEDDAFGRVLAFDGTYAFLGSRSDSGSIYIYSRSGTNWSYSTRLTSPKDPADGFGSSVAYDDPYLLVGADNASNEFDVSVGAVYAFRRNGSAWTPEVCFGASAWQRGAAFGNAVAVHGDRAVVGAYNETNGMGHGAIYLFARSGTNWIERARVVDPVGKLYDYFGSDVAIWSNDVVVGAPQAGQGNFTNGLAFFYRIDEAGTALVLNNVIQYPRSSGNFGESVAIGNALAVIGGDSAYVCFKNGTNWVRQIRYQVGVDEKFGHAVDVSGQYVAIGNPWDNAGGIGAGAAWVYEVNPRNRQDEVWPTGEDSIDLFGQAAATWGRLAFFVAKGGVTATSGLVYVFRNTGDVWVAQERLYPDDRTNCPYYGQVLEANDGYLVAAGPGDGVSGLAYVYNCMGTNCIRMAELSGGTAHETFGNSASIDSGTVAIGATEEGSLSAGTVHIYVRENETWTRQQSLAGGTDAGFYGAFGADVDLSGDTLIVGAPMSDAQGDTSGSAFIYVRQNTNWVRQAVLVADDWTAGDQFGRRVALDGDTAAVHSSSGADKTGAVYLFGRQGTNWIAQGKLTRADAVPGGYFGWDLDLRGNVLLAGARLYDGPFTNSGGAWMYRRQGTNWVETGAVWAGDGAVGDSYGSAVSLGDDFAVIGAEQKLTDTGYILCGQYGFNAQPVMLALTVGENSLSLNLDGLDRFVTNRVEYSGNLADGTWTQGNSFVPECGRAQVDMGASGPTNAAFFRIVSP